MDKGSLKNWLFPAIALILIIVVAGGVFLFVNPNHPVQSPNTMTGTGSTASANNVTDPGTSLDGRPAPDFTLTDQFGKKISLSQYKDKVVVLAFVDSECTTVCPLTTESMMRAMRMIGPKAASHVQLLGIDANPEAISVADVKNYSQQHNMSNSWHFLTGSLSQLKSTWNHYNIYDQIVHGAIDHTPALYIIGPNGKEQYVFLTPMKYAAVDAQSSIIAQQVSKFLPESVKSKVKNVTYTAPEMGPSKTVSLPLVNGSGNVQAGPGHPQLMVSFASWAPNVEQNLKQLDTYAGSPGAPEVVAVDVLPSEPNNKPATAVLQAVSPKHYQVALDQTGDFSDSYGVIDLMWIALTDGKGHIIWSHDGWLPPTTLQAKVKAALAKVAGN